ncbi:hypothetical protein PMAYCL1PPCAC_00874, partial [Pristionchus mayeri]
IETPPKGWQHDTDFNMLKNMGCSRRTLIDFDDDSMPISCRSQGIFLFCIFIFNWIGVSVGLDVSILLLLLMLFSPVTF